MNTPNPEVWVKSTYSQAQGECVEVAFRPHTIAARDSKNPKGAILEFPRQSWTDFVDSVNADDIRPPHSTTA